jgi:hypothetical protein
LRRARSRSFVFSGETATIRPAYVRPRRTIVTVEIVLSTSFCAVPALSRVEPATASGPTTTAISWSARPASALSLTHATAMRNAPASRATSSAASVYGVAPLALTPTTTSSVPIPSARRSAAPASRSSSASSVSPATTATTSPGRSPNVGPHSAASSAATLPDVPAPT